MLVRQAQGRDPAAGHAGLEHLALRSLPAVDENACGAEAHQRGYMITFSRRHLARRTQRNDLQATHGRIILLTPAASLGRPGWNT
ncbi:hypothetical protein GCM10027456_19920 [Kineosporia babensis]